MRGMPPAPDADPATPAAASLDGLVARVLDGYGYEFAVARTEQDRATAYRIRHAAAVAAGWLPETAGDGLEHDEYDEGAIHVVGHLDGRAVSAGRVVLPPARLPTEDACGFRVEPAGRVADVGRMAVVPEHQSRSHAAFVALMCRLYLEVRTAGYTTACGMMSAPARRLVRMFGLTLEMLGDDRTHWHEPRAPVRFSLLLNADSLADRWPD